MSRHPSDYLDDGDPMELDLERRPPRRPAEILASLDYRSQYLRSPEWREKRRQRLNLAKYRCEQCGAPDGPPKAPLDVHHLAYDRLGNENIDEDLVALCRPCHEVVEGRNR